MLGEFFHVGILVADLDQAVDRYQRLLRRPFNEPARLQLDTVLADGAQETVAVRVSYSRVGPPYTELVEAAGDGIFSLRHGEGPHHLGFWVPSGEDVEGLLASARLKVEAAVLGSTGAAFARFTDPRSTHGARLELIDESRRPGLEAWFAGAAHPGHD